MSGKTPKFVSIVLPCLNEEDSVGICIKKIKDVFLKESIKGEIVVVDNGSTDATSKIAAELGARVLYQPIQGYGAAYIKGLDEANGEYIIIADADDTYDFYEIPKFISLLEEGYDFVMGSRFKGNITKGAMTWSHKYIGNPVITFVFRTFFKSKFSDVLCGMRAFTNKAYLEMDLKCLGMEFGTEMIFSSMLKGLKTAETPINYFPRKGKTKLNAFKDAWRYFRFMLLFSPNWLFLVPGFILFIGGLLALIFSGWGRLTLFGHKFDVHAMIFFTFFSLLGFKIINLGFFAKSYSFSEGFEKEDAFLQKIYRKFTLEKGIFIGFSFFSLGSLLSAGVVIKWIKSGFGPLNEVKLCLLGLLFTMIGVQTIFSSFFLSILTLSRKK